MYAPGMWPMEDYNFWQDFFDTYQSLSDWMKFAWLVVPATFLLALIALNMRYRIATKRVENEINTELDYTVYRDAQGQLQILRHGELTNQAPELGLLARDAEGVPPAETLK